MLADRPEGLHYRRPHAPVRRRFATDVAPVQFGERRVEVVGVEQHDGCDSPVHIGLGDQQGVDAVRLRPVVVRRTVRREHQMLTANGDFGGREERHPDVRDRPQIVQKRLPAATDPRVHDGPTVLVPQVFGHRRIGGRPVTGRERRPESCARSARGVLQQRLRPIELVESGDRRIHVVLVE